MAPVERDMFGVPSSSVHSQQTNADQDVEPSAGDDLSFRDRREMERLERLYAGDAPHAEALELAFRHGGWMADRKRVREAMVRCGVPAKRIERFDACGGGCVCEVRQGDGQGRLRAFYCGDRLCVPCISARSRRVQGNLMRLCEGCEVRFMTLTLRGTEEPLSDVIDRLIRSFRRLRDQAFWKNTVKGGAYCIEIKRGRNLGLWHVHLHALLVGSYVSQHELKDGWCRASGGSTVVDIRAVGNDPRRIGYVAKYASKGFDRSVVLVPNDLDECLCALRGRRVFGTFGCWRSVEFERETSDPGRWRVVGRFTRVWHEARSGSEWAVGFFRSLGIDVSRGVDGEDPDGPKADGEDPFYGEGG